MTDLELNQTEARVLGCLLEKEMTTSGNYPLSLAALTNACNQKTNREPVVSYDEETVLGALESLHEKQLIFRSSSGRVEKYGQNFTGPRKLVNKEAALLCVLLLRGRQTVGELRSRSGRLHKFTDRAEVSATLAQLADVGLVMRLPKESGRKEARYGQKLYREAPGLEMDSLPDPKNGAPRGRGERIAALERQMAALQKEMVEFKQRFFEFKSQFE